MVLLSLVLLASTPRIDAYVSACPVPVDGFSAPPSREPASAPAAGLVQSIEGARVEVMHCFYENHQVREVRTVVEGVTSIEVKPDERVMRGQRLGRGSRVKVTIDGVPPKDFARGKEHLLVPAREAVLLVIDVGAHRAVRFESGKLTHEWEVGQGQIEGIKEQRGDLKTPRGLYFVVQRSTGPFAGAYAAYFGPAWVKVSYPNAFDAQRGLAAGLITSKQADDISQKWKRRVLTPQNTKLGGGIGFHGWNEPWDGATRGFKLSWGCVVLHPEEMRTFYELMPLGAAVVLI